MADVQYCGGIPSVLWGKPSVDSWVFSAVGDTTSTIEGYHIVQKMLFSTIEDIIKHFARIPLALYYLYSTDASHPPPQYWMSSILLTESPTLMVSFHRLKTSSTIPNILHNAYGIPHSTNGIPQQYWWYPHQYWATSKVIIVSLYRNEHSPHYWRYFFTALMVSLYIAGGITPPNSIEHPPMYW